MLDPRIIMGGQTPDIMGGLSRGIGTGQQMRQAQTQNRLADLYQTQGAGIMAGDQNALNALAGLDPMAALGVTDKRLGMDATRLGMDATRQSMGMQRDAAKRQAAQYAQGLSNDQRAAEAAQLERGLSGAAFFYSRGDKAGYDNFLQQQGMDPAQFPFEQFEAQAAMVGDVLDVLKGFQPAQPEFGISDGQFYDKNNPGAGAQPIPGMTQTGAVGDPAAVAELKFRAAEAGLVPGTPEYQSFMMNAGGDAANFRALDQQAQASGLTPGTPQYQQFMASRGAGDIAGASESARLRAQANLGGAAAAAEDIGKATVAAGMSAWEGYGKLQTSLGNIDEAISAIDGGSQSGFVYNMLPNVTQASASLENAMQRMGLDVIGSVTFGALSEGEMKLAMSTAVPQNLKPADLRAWLVRRRDAQEKAAAMLANAAQFMTVPGNTINGWIQKNIAARNMTLKKLDAMSLSEVTQYLQSTPVQDIPQDVLDAIIAKGGGQ